MGALELCREELQHRAQPEQLQRLVAIMEKETERIAAIVRRVRDFYRPVRQEKRLIDIRAVVNDVLELAGEQLLRYNIAVERDMAGNEADQLPLINVNRDDLKQVLLNLVLNAIDAMETSGGTLRVRTAPDRIQPPGTEPRPAVRIEIGDTGTGIPPEFLPHIFEPFVTTRPDQATPIVPKAALGLSISYGIIQAYGGEISVSSQTGIGTTFTILLSAEQS
jgi:signal transduction histidine kinase